MSTSGKNSLQEIPVFRHRFFGDRRAVTIGLTDGSIIERGYIFNNFPDYMNNYVGRGLFPVSARQIASIRQSELAIPNRLLVSLTDSGEAWPDTWLVELHFAGCGKHTFSFDFNVEYPQLPPGCTMRDLIEARNVGRGYNPNLPKLPSEPAGFVLLKDYVALHETRSS